MLLPVFAGCAVCTRDAPPRNVLAIVALLREFEDEELNATAAEQVVLSRFIGFGAAGLANNLSPCGHDGFKSGWDEIGERLPMMTTDAEWVRGFVAQFTDWSN